MQLFVSRRFILISGGILTAASWAMGAGLYFSQTMSGSFSADEAFIRAVFILLAALTVPHMLLVDTMYRPHIEKDYAAMTRTITPQTADRKNAHLDLAKASQPLADHPLDAVSLPYCALPECDLNRVSLTTEFLGTELDAPLIITGMTGGTDRAMAINRVLADTAQKKKIALGLGSQRASLESGQSQAELRRAGP